MMTNKAESKDYLFPYVGQPKSPAYMWLLPSVVRSETEFILSMILFFKKSADHPTVVSHMNHSSLYHFSFFLLFFLNHIR